MMNKGITLIIVLIVCCGSARCDTIDHWQVYLNRELVEKFNINEKYPILELSLKESDTVRIHYNTCSGRPRSVMIWCPVKDAVLCWNDGDYYSRYSSVSRLRDPHDSAYWENVYEGHGHGEVQILGKDLIALAEQGKEVPFYYTNLSRHEQHFADQLIFVMSYRKRE